MSKACKTATPPGVGCAQSRAPSRNKENVMSKKGMTWALTDHLCKWCGGRVLRCVSGGGPTGGGNPIWKCADCGKAAAAMGPEVLCWCGFSHKHNHTATAYVCQPFTVLETKPELLADVVDHDFAYVGGEASTEDPRSLYNRVKRGREVLAGTRHDLQG